MNFAPLPIPFALMILVLWLMKRPWRCGCKSWWRPYTTGTKHYSQHLLDPWSVSHVGHGIFFYGTFRGFMTTHDWTTALLLSLSVEAVWEVVENTPWAIAAYRRSGDRFYYGDSILNSVGDLAVCLAGALLTGWFV